MMEPIRPWDELSREEKIEHLFDYPESMRDGQAKDLWGPEASGYCEHIHFPPTVPWEEVVEVIKRSRHYQTVYVRLTDKDFKTFDADDLEGVYREEEKLPIYKQKFGNEYRAFLAWRKEMLRNTKPKPLKLELYDDNRLICRVCTEEGDRGDEFGFGMEPDMWASGLLDFEGNVIQPFVPGYIPRVLGRF